GATAGATLWCALGSVKSNIGHGEGVAGIAGLTKLLLQMRHGQLVPSLHADTLNPRIDFSGTPFTVQRELATWPRPAGHPRRAGVSSFGAGGANAHLLVEEYVAPVAAQSADALSPALIVLSAANPDRLRAVAQRLADFLDGEFGHGITLAELAYTLQVGREALAERLGFVADSLTQVRACLAAFLQDREAERPLLRTSVGRGCDGRSAMLDDEGLAQTLRGWVERGKHELLLKLWGQGEPLDWSLLYRGARPRRVSLPGYPFAGERYWASAAVRYAGVVRSRRARPAADPHLLLCRPAWREAPVPAAARRELPRRELWLLGSLATLDDAALPALPIERFHSDEAEPVQRCADLYGQIHARLRERLRNKPSEPVLLQVAILGRDDDLLLSGLSGMLRSLGQESRKLHGQLLIMEGGEDPATWQARLDENAMRSHEDWVRYRQGCREIWTLQELPPAAAEPALPWRAQGVYLLSGGAGGLGLLFAEEIARRAEGATVILASRAAPDEARRARLAAFGQHGLAVQHAVLDITDAAAVQALVDEIVATHGRLDGVLHLAGVLRDGYLLDKEHDSVEQVLAPKLLGALHLDLATRALPLDCFVLFSSAAALFGNAGQADYAGANGFLDAFAAYRQAQGRSGRSLSVNWPLWAKGGMSMDTATEQLLSAGTGIQPMQAATGCRALAHALAGEFTQVLALEGEPVRMRAALLETAAPSNTAADAASPAADLPGQVRALVAALLKVEPEEIEAGQDIGDYGLDSIGFTHLANQLNQRFGSAMRPADFMDLETASVERIAHLLLPQLAAAAEVSGAPARAAVPESSTTSVAPATRRGPPGSGTVPASCEAGAAHPDERLRAQVREAVAALLKVELEEVELDLDISDYGVDSIGFTHLANRLNEQHGTRLRATDFLELEQVSVIRIARLLREDPGSYALLDAAGAGEGLAGRCRGALSPAAAIPITS
ncbi:MAG: SDR family NAD(P)-dependent oxidoreductase, partial [Burkholderia sp.]